MISYIQWQLPKKFKKQGFYTIMIHIKQAIIVEGKYDKIKLESFLDALIIPTNGFRIFKDKETCHLIRALADTVGLLIITDSDTAGFKIRGYLRSITKNSPNVQNIYIPQIAGKEKRKSHPSKEGTLGVEGLDITLLKQILSSQMISYSSDTPKKPITKMDFYQDGLTGTSYSAQKRSLLCNKLNLPQYLSANAMLAVLNAMLTYEEYQQLVHSLEKT